MKISLKGFLYLSFLFLFLPSMYIFSTGIPVYDVIILIAFILLFIFLGKKNLYLLYKISSIRAVKYLFLYVLWCLFAGAILVVLGKFSIINYIYSIFILLIFNNISWFLLPVLTIPRIVSIKSIKKILLIGIYIICIYGLLVYILNSFGLDFINIIQNIINNRRENIVTTRNLSVFEEPGYFGSFICITLPLIYKTVLSEFKIVKNIILNYFIKKTYIPLIWITLLTIKSPIWLIFSLISTLIYFYNFIKIKIRKHFILIFTTIITLIIGFMLLVNLVNLKETFLKRAFLVIQNVNNLEKFILVEPSLANRFLSYKARLHLFFEYPITGVGYKNAENVVISYFNKSTSPLTLELQRNITNSISTNRSVGINGAILWDTLSNTGLVGFLLLYSFYFSSVILLHKIILRMKYSENKIFFEGIKLSLISIIAYSFYDIRPNFVYFWFLFGLSITFINYYYLQKNERNF